LNRALVKVCGLADVESAVACARLGADWIGLNFHPPSPRSITPEVGREIASALAGLAEPVGLFVDRPAVEVAALAASIGLETIQLHGDETPSYIAGLARLSPSPLRIVRAFRLADAASIARMDRFVTEAARLGSPLHAVLVDAHVPGLAGGTGRSIPFDVLEQVSEPFRVILAGGLTPENVGERVARVRPWMVDVASGVESSPGVKDMSRVCRFVEAARATSDSLP